MKPIFISTALVTLGTFGAATSCATVADRAPPGHPFQSQLSWSKPSEGCPTGSFDAANRCIVCNLADGGCSRMCQAGNGDACCMLGSELEMSQHNTIAAKTEYERACAMGSGPGCESLAHLLVNGPRSTKIETDRGVSIFEQMCEHGRGHACALYGEHLLGTVGRTADMQDIGSRALRRGCELSSFEACQLVDQLPLSPEQVEPAVRVARDLFLACKHGDQNACHSKRTAIPLE